MPVSTALATNLKAWAHALAFEYHDTQYDVFAYSLVTDLSDTRS